MADDWGDDPIQYATMDHAEAAGLFDRVFGKGKWKITGGYRTPAREDELRREGAETVAPGHRSAHSEGAPEAPGAYDIVVDGLSPAQAADRLQKSGAKFTKLFPEGQSGSQGAHLHVQPMPQFHDDWGDEPLVTSSPLKPDVYTGHAVTHDEAATLAPKRKTPLQLAGEAGSAAVKPFVRTAEDTLQGQHDAGAALVDDLGRFVTPPKDWKDTQSGFLDMGRLVTDAVNVLGGGAASGLAKGAVGRPISNTLAAMTGGKVNLDPQAVGNVALAGAGLAEGLAGDAALAGRASQAGVGAEALRANEALRATGPRNALAAINEPPSTPALRRKTMTPEDQQSADVRLLHGEGVRMTPGQIRGGVHKDIESKQASGAHGGFAIHEAIKRSITDFNRTLYKKTLRQVGEDYPADGPVNHDAVAHIHAVLDGKYEALKPKLKADVDPKYDEAILEARRLAGVRGSREQREFDAVMKDRVGPEFGLDGMTGEGFKRVESYLTKEVGAYRNSTDAYQRKLGEALDDVLGALRGSLERHSDPSVRDELRQTNSAWASLKTIEDAAYAAKAQDGVFTPNQFLTALGRGGRTQRAMVARGRGRFQDFTRAAQRVLPNKVPDSGTAGREGVVRGPGRQAGTFAGAFLGEHLGPVGGPMGAVAGGMLGASADAAISPVTNALRASMLERQAAKALARRGVVSAQPRNYLRAVDRRALAAPTIAPLLAPPRDPPQP
jgi:hypothetical protein